MLTFSLRQCFVAIAGLAVGLAIWRLPKGNLVDIPLTVLSLYFVASLIRQGLHLRPLHRELSMTTEQRSGTTILAVQMFVIAGVLVFSIALRALAAAGIALKNPDDFVTQLDFEKLPQTLTVLSLLVAIALGVRRSANTQSRARATMSGLAMLAAVAVLVIYWADQLFVNYLVFLAIDAVRMGEARPTGQDMIVDDPQRIERFAVAGAYGLIVIAANLFLFGCLMLKRGQAQLRSTAAVGLGIGLIIECSIAWWIASRGLWQLCPPMYEVRSVPTLPAVVALLMFLLAGAVFAWRNSVRYSSQTDNRFPALRNQLFESAAACFGLSALSAVYFAHTHYVAWQQLASISSPFTPPMDWSWHIYIFLGTPTRFIWLAAGLAGTILGIARLRTHAATSLGLPSVDPWRFATIFVGSIVLCAASAPIIAAASFSYWSVINRF